MRCFTKLLPYILLLMMTFNTAQSGGRLRVWVNNAAPVYSGIGCRNTAPLNSKAAPVPGTSRGMRSTDRYEQGHFVDVDPSTTGTSMTFIVTTTADTGGGSFRKALEDANSNPGLDSIRFSIGSGGQTITPQTPFPDITSPVVIDGTTQPGFSSTPIIELNGSNVQNGLTILAGNSTVRGLVMNRFQASAIYISTLGDNVIETNFIGLNTAGDSSLPNQGNGVFISRSPNNRIGDTTSASRNVISGNMKPNIAIAFGGSNGNIVRGNYIGTDQAGISDLTDSSNGVILGDSAAFNIIGGLQFGARNLISGNGAGHLTSNFDTPGIAIKDAGTSFNVIQANYIGVDWIGVSAVGNGGGILIIGGASNNLIGSTSPEGSNTISGTYGYYAGIQIAESTSTNNVVQGNIIGANKYFNTPALGNYDGVWINNARNNTIGGTTVGAGNYIMANRRHGVLISGSAASGNHIENNYIGAKPDPLSGFGLPNAGSGVFIDNAPGNAVGGSHPLAGNFIGQNQGHGVVIRGDTATANVVQRNFIGTDLLGHDNYGNKGNAVYLIASGDTIGGNDLSLGNVIAFNGGIGVFDSSGTNNTIRFNSIHSNRIGIDLAPRGITPNDSLDGDPGPNGLQNFPILDSASLSPGSIRIRGKLNSQPNTTYTLDFFKNDARDSTHFGEGETWIGSATAACDATGKAEITVTFSASVRSDQFITATAIDPSGNTSEFSRALCLEDKDGDGIVDCWESEGDGIDVNADGVIDLDLYAKGARPNHKDLFVEVDFMDTYRPADLALAQVRAAFAQVNNILALNPDGNNGINLYTDVDSSDVIPETVWALDPWPEFLAAKAAHFGTTAERGDSNARYILEAKKLVYRYCIFARAFGPLSNASSGKTRNTPGNDFFVSLGRWHTPGGTVTDQEGTFMHELGHTLGLQHGGGDGINYKPNYYSVMNYLFMVDQDLKPGTWTLNYSPKALVTLDESRLPEFLGFNATAGWYPIVQIPYRRPDGKIAQATLKPYTAVDWDGNGDSTNFALDTVDVNHIDPTDPASPGQTLYSYADWPNLKYNFRHSPGFPSAVNPAAVAVEEMTQERVDYLRTLPPYGIAAPLVSWPADPGSNIPISTGPLAQGQPVIASDGKGGAIVAYAWNTAHYSGYGDSVHIYAQRIDTLGGIQWRNNGVPICTVNGGQNSVAISADGAGGAFLVWQDSRSGLYNVYAQRINQWGEPLWAIDGVAVTTSANESRPPFPQVISGGDGGAIIAWRDGHSGTYSVYAQRLDASGTVQWPAEGALISTSPATVQDFVVQSISDDSGGAIIAWVDQRSGTGSQNYDIYAQRVNSAGALLWMFNGTPICASANQQDSHRLVGDGSGGAIIAWADFRDGSSENIYAQHVNAVGQVRWAANGVAISTGAGFRYYPEIVGDGSGGAVVAWSKRNLLTNYEDIYSQRISALGTVLWTTDGVAIADTGSSLGEVTMVSDNSGGAIIAFSDKRGAGDLNLYAQHVDSSGVTRWTKNGLPISSAPRSQWFAVSTSDQAGGAILSWRDNRNESNGGIHHIYAQNVTSNGLLGGGVVTSVKSPSGFLPSDFKLYQNYPNPFNPTTTIRYELPRASHVSLRVYNILGQEVAVLVDDVQGAGVKSVIWNASKMSSGVYFYRLQAGTFFAVQKMALIK